MCVCARACVMGSLEDGKRLDKGIGKQRSSGVGLVFKGGRGRRGWSHRIPNSPAIRILGLEKVACAGKLMWRIGLSHFLNPHAMEKTW